MKKVIFTLFVSFFFVFLGFHYSFGQGYYMPWNYWYQQPYDPWGYQPPYYDPWGYQQSYYEPWSYQQSYYSPWNYQQSYFDPWSYQQSYYDPWSYQQSYYSPWNYQQSYYSPWNYQQSYFDPLGYQQSYYVDSCGIPGGGAYGKPAIYLYPEVDTNIIIGLDIDGQLTQTIPSYDDGWYVLATPNGDIFDMRDGYIQNIPYDYLFWEAETDLNMLEPELPVQGWVVAMGDLSDWFSENLPLLGLNEKEKTQFMEYWLEKLSADLYEIKLLSSEFLAEHATLIITPQPNTLIRVIFFFRPLNELITLDPPVIVTPTRTGFTVLEWGGILGY